MKVRAGGVGPGRRCVPGDKSISHRAVLVGAVAEGESVVTGFGRSGDTESTIAAVRALGVRGRRGRRHRADRRSRAARAAAAGRSDRLRQRRHACPPAPGAPRRPARPPVRARRRRVAQLAADATDRRSADADGGRDRDRRRPSPARDRRAESCGRSATSCRWRARRSSRASCSPGSTPPTGPTIVVEPVPTRDHTERMLRAAGARAAAREPGGVEVWPAARLEPLQIEVPGDFSAAAPFVVAATLLPGSRLRLARRRRQPDAHRAPRTCSSAWARGSPSTTGRPSGRRAGRRRRGRARRPRRHRGRAGRGAAADRRAAALRARRLDGPR